MLYEVITCVGITDNILVSSTIGRNKQLIPGEVISAIINGTEEVLAELRKLGVNTVFTGGETADVGDLVRTVIRITSYNVCYTKLLRLFGQFPYEKIDKCNNKDDRKGDDE